MRLIDAFVDARCMAPVERRDLAGIAAMPVSTFSRLFKRTTGETPYQYVLRRRIARAAVLIRSDGRSLAQIAYDCGFASQSHMTDVFRAKLGVTPGRMRRDGAVSGAGVGAGNRDGDPGRPGALCGPWKGTTADGEADRPGGRSVTGMRRRLPPDGLPAAMPAAQLRVRLGTALEDTLSSNQRAG
ncbi:MAG: helix-turn-helix transcriptional regulator, partial [Pseudomonadota bacterium]